MNEMLKKINVSTIVFNIILTLSIILVTKHFTVTNAPPIDKHQVAKDLALDITTKTNDVSKQVSTDKLQEITSSVTIAAANDNFLAKESDVVCTMYIMPDFSPIPTLPSKEVMEKATKDQLIYILYQNIKDHQNRIVENRKSLYESYNAYLKSCK